MLAQKYNLAFNPDLYYLIESIKVESYWNHKNFSLSLQNKNLPFSRNIERILKNLNFSVSKRILIKIKPPQNKIEDEIKLSKDNKFISWYFEKSPFDDSLKIVTSLPYTEEMKLDLEINNKKYPIIIKEGSEEYGVNSIFPAWVYLDLRFPNKRILSFLDEYLGEDKILKIEDSLLKASNKEIMAAFSALVDCEGSISHYDLFRRLEIRMDAYDYLNDWKKLLLKFGIESRTGKRQKLYGLTVEGFQDFSKLNELGFKPIHSKKLKRWNKILISYKRKQVSRNHAKEFYIQKLKEIKRPITAKEFSEITGKSKRVVNHYLTKLMKENLIEVDKSNVAYLYSAK